jgi:two-component system LytT family response regulator
MMNAVLIDDDRSNLSSLSEKLAKHCPQITVASRCDNPHDGMNCIENLKPDVVFLDIEMPLMNGFVMLQQLVYKNFALIFVTAYDNYAIKAIRYSALDYLVKPVQIPELKIAVAKAETNRKEQQAQLQIEMLLEHISKKQPQRITIPTTEGLQFISLDDIIYLEASDNYTNIYLASSKKFLVSRTLKSFEDILPCESFLRIHHGTIVNKLYVEKYIRGEGGQVVLRNGIMLDVSKRKKAEFLHAIGH